MTPSKCILLIRHGLTDANSAAVIQGHQQTSLNQVGLEQARLLGEHLGRSGLWIDALISSDLLRASQTAEPIARACQLEITLDAQWRERRFGPWEGRALDQADIWRMAAGEFDPPGAEPAVQFRDRIRGALLSAAERCPANGVMAIVTHGGPCRMVLRMLAEGELLIVAGSARPALEMIANCSIMHLQAQADREGLAWRLVRMNDVDHLDPLRRTAADAG